MLSIGEVHSAANMGLNRGGGFRSDFGRDAFGLDASGTSNVMLQQQLNELIQNSYLLQHQGPTQCSSLNQGVDVVPSLLAPGDAAGGSSFASQHGLTSLGFSQSDIDRTMLFDAEFPPVVDHQSFISVSNAHASVSTFAPVGLTTSSSFVGLPAMSLPRQVSREHWGDVTATHVTSSQRGMKREGEFDQISMQPPRKSTKLDKSARTVDAKGKRPTEQADHILRERQRRDDMTSKFAVLESLLPVGVKRDRSTIVDDSIEYVKNLHHRIKSLQDRKAELNNQSAAGATSNGRRGQKAEVLQQPSHGSPSKDKDAATGRRRISEEELSIIHGVLRGCLEKMEVHADLPRQVVIEMVCKPQPRLQSHILLCLESFDLDVMQCSITKIAHRLICVITAKPQGVNTATSGIVAALKCALQG